MTAAGSAREKASDQTDHSLGAFLQAISQGLCDSRDMLSGVEQALMAMDRPMPAGLQVIDRIGQRLDDHLRLIGCLAAASAELPLPLTTTSLADRIRLAEIRDTLPGLATDMTSLASSSDDPVLF